MLNPLPLHRPDPEELGRASRKAATAAMEAHLGVLKGEPLRLSLSQALAKQKGLGGQERRFAALACRELSRHQRLLDFAAKALGQAPSDSVLKEDQALVRYLLWRRLVTGVEWPRLSNEVKLPGPLRPRSIKDDVLERLATSPIPDQDEPPTPLERWATVYSFPRWLSERLSAEVPEAEWEPLFAAIDREPSLILRARGGSRESVLESLAAEGVRAEPLPWAPHALRVLDPGGRVFETRAMKGHRLQVQDLGSQLIVELCRPSDGAWTGLKVADVCAGAGGKTLALADAVGPTGRVLAGDNSWRRLGDAKDRAKDFKLTNIRFSVPAQPKDEEVVLVDAPCSGTGSLHREPDQKWKLSAKKVTELAVIQRELLDQVAGTVRAGALIVYATCSLLREENEDQVQAFLQRHPDFQLEDAATVLPAEACREGYLRAFPHRLPGGGFFGARLRKTPRG